MVTAFPLLLSSETFSEVSLSWISDFDTQYSCVYVVAHSFYLNAPFLLCFLLLLKALERYHSELEQWCHYRIGEYYSRGHQQNA